MTPNDPIFEYTDSVNKNRLRCFFFPKCKVASTGQILDNQVILEITRNIGDTVQLKLDIEAFPILRDVLKKLMPLRAFSLDFMGTILSLSNNIITIALFRREISVSLEKNRFKDLLQTILKIVPAKKLEAVQSGQETGLLPDARYTMPTEEETQKLPYLQKQGPIISITDEIQKLPSEKKHEVRTLLKDCIKNFYYLYGFMIVCVLCMFFYHFQYSKRFAESSEIKKWETIRKEIVETIQNEVSNAVPKETIIAIQKEIPLLKEEIDDVRYQLVKHYKTKLSIQKANLFDSMLHGVLNIEFSPKEYIECAFVPAGSFKMGISQQVALTEYIDLQQNVTAIFPDHEVKVVSGFFISKTEITNRMFEIYLEDSKNVKKGDFCKHLQNSAIKQPNQPVRYISWEDCIEFCSWLQEKCGNEIYVRLPSEIEWEYAARGMTDWPYPWGKQEPFMIKGIGDVAGSSQDKSWCGVSDLSGSVSEWCLDEWDENAYKKKIGSILYDPEITRWPNPKSNEKRSIRGGSFSDTSQYRRLSIRRGFQKEQRRDFLGFRIVVIPKRSE